MEVYRCPPLDRRMQFSENDTAQLQDLLDKLPASPAAVRDELVGRASARLHRLAQRMLKNYPHLRRWEQTDDVFQNAAIRLHRSLADVHPESVRGFFGLAATQIRRTLIDLARHHFGPEGQAARHESGASHLIDAPGRPGEPTSLDEWAHFHEVVGTLPCDERETFELIWYGDLKQGEVANLLGVSVRTVKRRWQRARLTLGEALGKGFAE